MSIPGGTYLITRTTSMSLFLLTPSRIVNQIMEYCTAWAARGRGIAIHAVSVESNHYHMVVTDRDGTLSEFVQELNRASARCLLAHYRQRFPTRRFDAIWTAAQSFSAPLLVNRDAIIDKLIYTFTNPVKDGLVSDYRLWPGFNTSPRDWTGGPRRVSRPPFYFKNTPAELSYRVECPQQLGGDIEATVSDLERQIHARQRQAAVNLAARGRTYLGVVAVQAMSPLDSPRSMLQARKLKPHVAAAGDRAALGRAIAALRAFRATYRRAWSLLKRGFLSAFPGGTLLLRKRFGVPTEPLEVSWCELAS